MTVLVCITLTAQTGNVTKIDKNITLNNGDKQIKVTVKGNGSDLDAIVKNEIAKEMKIQMTGSNDEDDNGPFMGIFSEDLTLAQAAQKNYHEFYGIVITGIGSNSPAQQYKLMVDDILMKIDDNKITEKDQLLKVMQSYKAGDSVQLTIFRNGEQKVIPFVLGSKSKSEVASSTTSVTIPKKKSHSVGYGGGMWTPIWFMLDTDDVNHIIDHIGGDLASGFDNIPKDGIFMNGGAGKGTVGKGFFIGGMGAGYKLEKKYNVADTTHKMTYDVGFGGVTLDKRIHIAHHLTGSLGFMLGGGHQNINIVKYKYVSPSGYDWNDIGYVDLNKQMVHLKRNYIVFQPKTEVIYNLLSWLAIRGEVGYMMGYSSQDGWVVMNDGDAQVSHSPNSTFNGLTFSIGPWVGF